MIEVNEKDGLFFLESETVSYVMKVYCGRLHHLYFGEKIAREDVSLLRADGGRPFSPFVADGKNQYSLDVAPLEYSSYGMGDYRVPAITAEYEGGNIIDFHYSSYRIEQEKPKIKGMPSMRGGETLIITLLDTPSGLLLELRYTIYNEGAVARSASLINNGTKTARVTKLASAMLDINGGGFELIELSGRYAAEFGIMRTPLTGIRQISSSRGSSGHMHNPFIALVEPQTTEQSGPAFGVSLIYSGSFLLEAEATPLCGTRILGGLNPLSTRISLKAGESFESPEIVFVYSNSGIGGMSRCFHDLIRNCLMNPRFTFAERPVVLNSWESVYFNFDEDKICRLAESLLDTGAEMLVLDDGWFGHRDNDLSSLGDWMPHGGKLKNGLKKIIDCCKKCGLKFGLWFEPEMISQDSDLYHKHPDYCFTSKDRPQVYGRNQLVLDFSRKEVVDCIFAQMDALLSQNEISYIKWDMNRNLSNVEPLEKYHEYVLGVYSLYERLTQKYTNLLIEGCSGGGGRFDAGILYYSPQIWTSDNSDAYSRTFIQYGASLCYPLCSISNHVSVTPNHQTGRVTSFSTRGNIAMLGVLGYELNPALLSDKDREEMRNQIAAYKMDYSLIARGDLYRLVNPFTCGDFCEMVVSKDKQTALLVYLQAHDGCNMPYITIYPEGLHSNKRYFMPEKNQSFLGSTLMQVGITLPYLYGDYATYMLHFVAEE